MTKIEFFKKMTVTMKNNKSLQTLKALFYLSGKWIGVFLIILLFAGNLYGQTDIIIPLKNNKNIADIDTLKGVKNKVLRCEYDTLYIINHFGVDAFHKCVADLQRVKDLSGSLDNLTLNINGIQTNVNAMYNNISEVTDFVKKYNTETEKNLITLKADNKTLNDNLIKINNDLIEVQAKLKAQQHKNLGTHLLWGAGGVTVGGMLVGLLMMGK